MSRLPVVAVANQKGGVGKTTCCVNLAAELGKRGHLVLVVDMDPQAHSTSGLGVDKSALKHTTYDVLINDVSTEEIIISTPWRGVSVIPATIDLAGAEVELAGTLSRETRLLRFLSKVDDFDLILIDCPPSLGLLTINSLVAANSVLIPIQCEYYALEGVSQLLKTIDLIKRHLSDGLTVGGILLTMYDSRTRLSQEVAQEVRRQFGDLVFEAIIPRNVRLSEAPSYGQPIAYYDPSSTGALAFQALAEEVERRWLAVKP